MRKRRLALLVLGVPALLLLVLVGVGYAMVSVPAPNDGSTAQATRVLYADGAEIGRIGKSNRVLVPIDKVSDPAQKAVLAAEDRGFYHEPGISPTGIARALFTNLRGGGSVQQGGSTITQQYAKNAYLSSERTYTRKVREVFIALKLSHSRSKDEVLGDYLNTIYFGRGADGIEVAAKTYFGKSAKDLTAAQGAVLASSIRSPAGYDPTRHPQAARARWAYVLDGMVGQGWLSAQERATLTYPRVLKPGEGTGVAANDRSGTKGYILDKVEEELQAKAGLGPDEVRSRGYVVTTTLRRKAQDAAVAAVHDAVPGPKQSSNKDPVAALVSMEPGDGGVVAYVAGRQGNGGTDYASDETALRQPGSSFKPYVLATALDQGVGLDTQYDGSEPQQICGQTIRNDAGDPPLGQTDLVKGLALSVNTVYFRVACDVGPSKVADMAHNAGIPRSVTLAESKGSTVGAGIGLGIYGVHVIDQAVGYSTFAAKGLEAEPYFVQKVARPDKSSVYTAKTKTRQAFSEGIAADATYAMQQVVKSGTGTRAALSGRPVAGKTGTTSDNKDAWFCGFTPQLATVVWLGRPDNQGLKGVLGVSGGISGGRVPAQIFKAYMDKALDGEPVQDFPPRADVGSSQSTPSSAPTVVATTSAPVPQTTAPSPVASTPSAVPSASPSASPSAAPTTAAPTTAAPAPSTNPPSIRPSIVPTRPPTTAPPSRGPGGGVGGGGGH